MKHVYKFGTSAPRAAATRPAQPVPQPISTTCGQDEGVKRGQLKMSGLIKSLKEDRYKVQVASFNSQSRKHYHKNFASFSISGSFDIFRVQLAALPLSS